MPEQESPRRARKQRGAFARFRAMCACPRRDLAAALAAAGLLAFGARARAESALHIDYPASFGTIPAATYDDHRERVGAAHLVIERGDGGGVRLFSESGVEHGVHTVATAELAPQDGERWLRLEVEESRSFEADGRPRGVLRIDHDRRVASCEGYQEHAAPLHVELPEPDRVTNVPMNLFFLPLVRGEAERLEFQVFLCHGGPRFVDFEAVRAPAKGSAPAAMIEVRYGPQLGPLLALLAPRFLPKLAFWFDSAEPHRWMAHHVPLYSDGPEVYVIRDGIPPPWPANE
jgi:hypothetical protein